MNYAFKSRFIGIEVLFLYVFFVKACNFSVHLDYVTLFFGIINKTLQILCMQLIMNTVESPVFLTLITLPQLRVYN